MHMHAYAYYAYACIMHAYMHYKLQKLWGHSGVSRKEKLTCFHAFVVTGLLYGLSTDWLIQSQRRRLDGFYARCLRRILRIPASYVSRISNTTVFQKAGVLPLTEQLSQRQLTLLGQVVRASRDDPLRRDTFIEDTMRPAISHYIRKVGRPCRNWTEEVIKQGASRCGGYNIFVDNIVGSTSIEWKQQLQRLFASR